MNNKLYVGNISFKLGERELEEAFEAHGTVTDIHLINDRETGKFRGFGFITMATEEEAQAAIEGMHGSLVDGRPLTVNIARPREPREGGGGGGRRF